MNSDCENINATTNVKKPITFPSKAIGFISLGFTTCYCATVFSNYKLNKATQISFDNNGFYAGPEKTSTSAT